MKRCLVHKTLRERVCCIVVSALLLPYGAVTLFIVCVVIGLSK